jgi:D-alanyl-D-alanine carboxypeptidase (penicillin-binding protein 5/6)
MLYLKSNPVWIWASLAFILLLFLALGTATAAPALPSASPAAANFSWSQLAAVVPPLPPPVFQPAASLPPPLLAAQSWLVAYVSPDLKGGVEVLAEKEATRLWPLASVTKLMTALVASETLPLGEVLTFSPDDLVGPGDAGFYQAGDSFLARDLFDSLLVESSNSAALLLARAAGSDFVDRMNERARGLGLAQTSYVNANGLDPVAGGAANTSTARDLLQLAVYLLANHPDLLAIGRQPAVAIYQATGAFHHQANNTDGLLTDPNFKLAGEVVGGKTGQTDRAGKNLLLVLKDRNTGGYLVSVVLGSNDHLGDTAALLDWVYHAYRFGEISAIK